MTKLQEKKEVNRLTLLLTVTYMISYITRTNFGAIISENEFMNSNMSNSVSNAYFVAY